MKPVDLNFATTPFRNNTPYHLGYGLGALVIAAFTAYNAFAYMSYSKNQAVLESDYAQKKARLESLYEKSGRLQELIQKQDFGLLNERAAFTNKMLQTRRFSWTALLNSLEEVQPYQVRLLSLRPIATPKSIVVEARAVARDLKAFWTFQQNLQNDAHFRRVYPGGYLKNNELGEIIFNLVFNYFPEGSPADFVGLTAEEITRLQIVDAPGAHGGGTGDVADDDLPALEEEEPLPRAQKPHPPGPGGAKPPTAAAQVPGAAPHTPPAVPPTGQPVARGGQSDGRGAAPGAAPPTTPSSAKDASAQAMGAGPAVYVPPSGFTPPPSPTDANAPRPPVRLKMGERGAPPGSGGVRPPAPPPKDPPAGLPMPGTGVDDDKDEEGDDTSEDGN